MNLNFLEYRDLHFDARLPCGFSPHRDWACTRLSVNQQPPLSGLLH